VKIELEEQLDEQTGFLKQKIGESNDDFNPDRWVVLEVSENKNELIRKVYAGWYGGYLGSDSWKLSSGIIEVNEDDHAFEFINVSGSVYRCNKQAYGMSGLMCDVFESWQEKLKSIKDGSIRIVDEYEQK
jgi:hypothetical protein